MSQFVGRHVLRIVVAAIDRLALALELLYKTSGLPLVLGCEYGSQNRVYAHPIDEVGHGLQTGRHGWDGSVRVGSRCRIGLERKHSCVIPKVPSREDESKDEKYETVNQSRESHDRQ